MARWEFAFEIDRSHGMSFVQQIASALTAEIQRGRLHPGDRLPGSRTLARTLRVHRQTVVSAIDELIAEGWLVSRRASGVFVASLPEQPSRKPGASCANSSPYRVSICALGQPLAASRAAASGSRGNDPDVRHTTGCPARACRPDRTGIPPRAPPVRTGTRLLQRSRRSAAAPRSARRDAVRNARSGCRSELRPRHARQPDGARACRAGADSSG